jgi:uncharacterized protein (TIGR03067 family)
MTFHALTILAILAAADDPAAKDLKAMAGTWEATEVVSNGAVIPKDRVAPIRLTVEGAKYTVRVPDQGVVEEGTLKPAADKKPKEIDLEITAGNDKGKTQVGVYEIDGDTLKLCLARPGAKERPKELASKEGSNVEVTVFKRVKP